MKTTKQVTIHRLNFSGKWAEIWTTPEPHARFDLSCKSYQIDDLVAKAGLIDHVHQYGYNGLILEWRMNNGNWEPIALLWALPGLACQEAQ